VSDETDPPRLSPGSGSSLERGLATLVESARADLGTDEQLAKLEVRLLPLIGPPGPPGPGGPSGGGSASAAGATGALKAAVTAVVVGAAAAVAIFSHRAPAPTPTVVRAPPTEQEGPVAPVAPALPSGSTPAEQTIAPEAKPTTSVDAPLAPKEAPAPPTETDLVGQAQVALLASPARALALCEKHRRLYPHGVLVQEREVLAIEALEHLGRHSEAVQRGDRFLKAFPSSAHRSKIVSIVGSR